MKIAITLHENSIESLIPNQFETSQFLLVLKVSEMSKIICEKISNLNPKELAQKVIDYDCECIITGAITNAIAFDLLADACITRYNGSTYSGVKAVELMNQKKLPLTKTFSGESGCSGTHHH